MLLAVSSPACGSGDANRRSPLLIASPLSAMIKQRVIVVTPLVALGLAVTVGDGAIVAVAVGVGGTGVSDGDARGAGLTVIVTCAVRVFEPQRAVRV